VRQPAAPELDTSQLGHTATRPIHWLATATAIAGVIALAPVLQPTAAATDGRPGEAGAQAAPADVPPPDPADVTFPLDCGGRVQPVVARKASGDLDGDNRPETVVAVHCDAPMGTPPDTVYVLTRGAQDHQPRLIATLVDAKERHTVTELAVQDAVISATTLGYSTADVPSCCPDVTEHTKWQWENGAFTRSSPVNTRDV
jgi:hypothetical protein